MLSRLSRPGASGVFAGALPTPPGVALSRLLRVSGALVLLGLAGLQAARAAAEDPLPMPQGDIVLTITGNIFRTNDGHRAVFDRAMLEQLGLVTVETATPWSDGVVRYEGVLARDVLAAAAAGGDVIVATALNDYVAEIPITDFDESDVILALKENGEYLTPRDKGPLFIVYPFDSDPGLRSEEVYARSVWQLSELDVE